MNEEETIRQIEKTEIQKFSNCTYSEAASYAWGLLIVAVVSAGVCYLFSVPLRFSAILVIIIFLWLLRMEVKQAKNWTPTFDMVRTKICRRLMEAKVSYNNLHDIVRSDVLRKHLRYVFYLSLGFRLFLFLIGLVVFVLIQNYLAQYRILAFSIWTVLLILFLKVTPIKKGITRRINKLDFLHF